MTDAATIEPAAETAVSPPPDQYAVVEIFGHRRHVGRILEEERFGAKMLRVDVPNDGDFANGFVSHYYGGGSIFGLTPTTLDVVQRYNRGRNAEPPAGLYLPPPERAATDVTDRSGEGDDDDDCPIMG